MTLRTRSVAIRGYVRYAFHFARNMIVNNHCISRGVGVRMVSNS